jgi:predicted DNA binding protein/PAS domain-containing protein
MTIAQLSTLELLFGTVTAGAAVYVWPDRHTPVGRYLLLMLVGASGYPLASGAHVFVGDPTLAHVVHNGTYASGALLTAAGVLMVIAFTGREGLQRRWFVGGLCVFVLVDVFAAVTDPWVGAFISDPVFLSGVAIARTAEHTGPYFWVRSGGMLILALLSLLLILTELADVDGIYRRRLSLIATGQTFVIGMFLAQLVLPNVPGFDIASIGLLGGTLTIVVAVNRSEFGRLLPIAHKTLMDSLDDPVVVLSPDDRVVSINPSASALFGIRQSSVGRYLTECLPTETAAAAPFVGDDPGEVSFERHPNRRVYGYQVSPTTAQGMRTGRIITFRDITEQKEREDLLRDTRDLAQAERDGKELVTELLLTSAGRQTVARTACRLLVETYGCEEAWVVWSESNHESVDAAARGDLTQVETDVVEPLAARVLSSGTPETVDLDGEDGVDTVQATPIRYERLATGVLCTAVTGGPSESMTDTIRQIATALGFKRTVADQRATLLADYVEEITVEIDSDYFLGTVTADRQTPVDVLETYHTEEATVYMIEADPDTGGLETSLRDHEQVTTVSEVSTTPVVLAVGVRAATVSGVLTEFGGVTRSVRASAGRVTVTVEFTPRTDVRAALDAVADEWPTARMTKRRQRPTAPDSRSPADSLTPRQEDALRAATLLGFFDRPQRARAGDVAEALGVSRSTALQHIRLAEAKIFEGLFSDES